MNLKHLVFKAFVFLLIVSFSSVSFAGGVLKKGEPAPEDCRWFSVEESKELLQSLKELEALRKERELNELIILSLERRIKLLEESNELLAKRNEMLLKEIEKKKKWETVKNVATVIMAVGLSAVAAYASK